MVKKLIFSPSKKIWPTSFGKKNIGPWAKEWRSKNIASFSSNIRSMLSDLANSKSYQRKPSKGMQMLVVVVVVAGH